MSLVPLEGYVPTLTQHPHSEAVHHYFPKAGNFPGKFWKVASGSHNDSENTESVLRVQVTPMSPAQMEKTQWQVGLQAPLRHQLVTMVNCALSPVPSLTICKLYTVQAFRFSVAGLSVGVADLLQPVRYKTTEACLVALATCGLYVMVLETSHLSSKVSLKVKAEREDLT